MTDVNVEFIRPFILATENIFSSMVGIQVKRKRVYLKKGYRMFGDISALIGLSGATTGMCAVSLPAKLAVASVEKLIGEPVEQGIHDIVTQDGVGEIVNMIAGSAKATLSKSQYKFDITLPTIISGKGHEVFSKKGNACVVIVFDAEDGSEFTLDVVSAESRK